MTGPDHYREAERLIDVAREFDELTERAIDLAQVHATLALTAATALNDHAHGNLGEVTGGVPVADWKAWREVAGTPEEASQAAPESAEVPV